MGTNIIEGPHSFWGSLFSGSFRELNVVTETNGEKSTTSFFNGYMRQLFIQTRQSYIYPTVCLPTLRLSGSQHQCLILIPPTAFAFGFIVFYWCALKWLSRTLSAEIYAHERTHRFEKLCGRLKWCSWKPILYSEPLERTPFCHRLASSARLPPPGWYRAA